MTFGRAAAFVGIGYLSLLICGALRGLWAAPIPVPDIPLIIVLYLGLGARGSPALYAGTAIVLGYLADLLAGSPRGLQSLSLAIVMIIVRAVAGRLLVTRVWQELAVTIAFSMLHSSLVIALASPLYQGNAALTLWTVPAVALSTGAFALILYRLMRRIDRRLAPDPRSLRMPGS